MIAKNEDGTNVLEFGTGDIEVANGFTDDPEDQNPCVVFIPQKPGEIGARGQSYEKYGDECHVRNDAHTMFVFTDIRSIDVVIDHLNQARESMVKLAE